MRAAACLCVFSAPLCAKPSVALDLMVAQPFLERQHSFPEPFASKQNDLTARVRVRPKFPIGRTWQLHSPVSVNLPIASGVDGTVKTLTLNWCLGFSRALGSRLAFSFGPGVEWIFITPTGGTVTLRNGESTQNFYIPSQSKTAVQFIGYFGMDWFWNRRISISSEILIKNLGNKARMSFGLGVGLGVHL